MIRETDLLLSDNGDLQVAANGDLKLAGPIRTAKQDVATRIRTQIGEWDLHPSFGSNLARFYGERNNRENAERMKTGVYRSLVRDSRFRDGSVFVEVAPVGKEEVVVLVQLTDSVEGETVENSDAILTTFLFNYQEGDISLVK